MWQMSAQQDRLVATTIRDDTMEEPARPSVTQADDFAEIAGGCPDAQLVKAVNYHSCKTPPR
jgi:hypothetical protein